MHESWAVRQVPLMEGEPGVLTVRVTRTDSRTSLYS